MFSSSVENLGSNATQQELKEGQEIQNPVIRVTLNPVTAVVDKRGNSNTSRDMTISRTQLLLSFRSVHNFSARNLRTNFGFHRIICLRLSPLV